LIAIVAAILIIASIQYAQAEPTQIIQGSLDGTFVSIIYDDISNIIILEKDGITSEHYDGVIKTYNSGGFVIKNIESGIVLFAHPIGNEQYRLVMITNDNVYRLIGVFSEFTQEDTSLYDEPVSSVGTDITNWNIPSTLTRTEPTGVGKPLQIAVKADYVKSIFVNDKYEPNISVTNYWNYNDKIQDALVYLEISRDGFVMYDLEGITSSGGQWNPSVNILYPTFYPGLCYDVKITTQYQNQTSTIHDDFLVVTIAKYWESGSEYSISNSAIESDYDCNDDDAGY